MSDSFLTLSQPSRGELKEKGSKFLSFAFPATDEEEIKVILKNLKDEFWDASHHCYAYRLGAEGLIYRANDAGEPNHSAGDPILSQIKSLNLTDVLVVVVRYFGGTKLGVSGLISAYKAAAKEALMNAEIIEKFVKSALEIRFGFEQMSFVMKNLKSFECEVLEQSFDAETLKTVITLNIRKSCLNEFLNNLQGSLGIEITGNL